MTYRYTPTTAHVRDSYIQGQRQAFIASAGEHAEEFDRWLAAHDAEVAAKAWEEGYHRGNMYALDEPWDNRNHISRNPYRQDGDQP